MEMDKFNKICELAKGKKKKVAESVLEEVKSRIAAKKLEEGVGSTIMGGLAKLKELKAVKQAGNVVKGLKGEASLAADKYGMARKLKATRLNAAKFGGTGAGKSIADTAKANPLGAGLVGGGTLGTVGLAAWGLKKPKKVQEAVPFAFGKDKEGKDEGKSGKKGLPAFFGKGKGKDKGKDEGKGGKKGLPAFFGKGKGEEKGKGKAEDALAKAKAKKKGGKKGLPPAFLKGKGGDKGGPPAEGGKKEVPAFFKKG